MEQGLWNLFFVTGLPQVYLAIRGRELERERAWEEEQQAMTAFQRLELPGRQI